MKQDEYARKLKPWLDRAADGVGELQATRLRAARLRALDACGQPRRLFGLVPVSSGSAQALRAGLMERAMLFLPLAVFLAVLAYQSAVREPDLSDLDAQLLTQELPVDAYLDQDFRSWLGKPQG